MMDIALLTAGGTGTRMRQDIPKQFLHVHSRPILICTMEAFRRHPSIDAIIVVGLERWIDIVWAYAKQFNITRLRWVVPGGNTGHKSIRNGLLELGKHCDTSDVVMMHDGNRPMISPDIISDSSAKQKEFGSVVAVVPCAEVVFKGNDGESPTIDVPRDELLRTRAPHTYELGKLLWTHRESERLGISNTIASCDLMYRLGKIVYFSKGSERNLKITAVEGIEIFISLLDCKKEGGLK